MSRCRNPEISWRRASTCCSRSLFYKLTNFSQDFKFGGAAASQTLTISATGTVLMDRCFFCGTDTCKLSINEYKLNKSKHKIPQSMWNMGHIKNSNTNFFALQNAPHINTSTADTSATDIFMSTQEVWQTRLYYASLLLLWKWDIQIQPMAMAISLS